MVTTVVNIRHEKYDVYIGRAGKGQDGPFGNPFNSIDRDYNIARYEEYFEKRIKEDEDFRYEIHQLKGKRLGCFCKPFKKCHGDIIAQYLNRLPETKPVKLGVVGSRNFYNYEYMCRILRWYEINCIISGGARGADSLAARYAKSNSIRLKEFLPNWELHGKSAAFKRNKEIVEASDEIVAFWDGCSRGTKNTIDTAEKLGRPVAIYWPNETEEDELLRIG